jgi:hypothetical protein
MVVILLLVFILIILIILISNHLMLTWDNLHRCISVGRHHSLSYLWRISRCSAQLLGRHCSWRHLVALGTNAGRISKLLEELTSTLVLSLGIWTSVGGRYRLCASLAQLYQNKWESNTYIWTISSLLMSLVEGILHTRGRRLWKLDLLKGAIRESLNLGVRSVAWLLLVVVVEVVWVHLSEVSWSCKVKSFVKSYS